MKVRGQATLRGKIARIDGFSRWGEVHGLVALSLTPLMTCRGWSGLWRGWKISGIPAVKWGSFVCICWEGPGPSSKMQPKGHHTPRRCQQYLPTSKAGKNGTSGYLQWRLCHCCCIIKSFTSRSVTHELSLLKGWRMDFERSRKQ